MTTWSLLAMWMLIGQVISPTESQQVPISTNLMKLQFHGPVRSRLLLLYLLLKVNMSLQPMQVKKWFGCVSWRSCRATNVDLQGQPKRLYEARSQWENEYKNKAYCRQTSSSPWSYQSWRYHLHVLWNRQDDRWCAHQTSAKTKVRETSCSYGTYLTCYWFSVSYCARIN